jgi:hypothetical protein
MKKYLYFLIFGGIFFSLPAQERANAIALEYQTNVPFDTNFNSKYHNLDAHLLLSAVIKKINEALGSQEFNEEHISITIHFKGTEGALLTLPMLLQKKDVMAFQRGTIEKDQFNKRMYDWLNRSFRSSIPYR